MSSTNRKPEITTMNQPTPTSLPSTVHRLPSTAYRPLSPASRLAVVAAAVLGLLGFIGPVANAGVIYWDGVSASWATKTNWSTSSSATTPAATAIPNALDDLIFNISTANNVAETITLDGTSSAKSLTFNNAGATTLTGGAASRNLNLGSGGLTVNSGAVTFGNGTAAQNVIFVLAATQQTWTNNSASNFTIANSAVSSFTRSAGSTLTFNQASSGLFSMSTTHLANTNSIVGPWAFFGTGAGTKYAYNNAGTIAGFSGTVAATATDLTGTTGAVNYDLADATGTIGAANFSGNTLRYTGAAATLAPGATSFTVNGLLNVGSGLWTIGTNKITIGSFKELVVNAATNDIAISSGIANNGGSASALTKTGTGTLTLSGSNTYTGLTTLTGGTLVMGGSNATSGINFSSAGANPTILVTNALAAGAGIISFTNVGGALDPSLQLHINGGGTIAMANAIGGSSGLSPTIDVNNNGDGTTNGVIQLNGTMASSSVGNFAKLNVTGSNGYSLFIANIRGTAGSPGTLTFNPTTAALSLGDVTYGNLTAANGTQTWAFDGTNAGNSVTGVISDRSTGGAISAVTKSNSSTWVLSGTNTYTGNTTIAANGGTLKIGGSGQLGSGNYAGTISNQAAFVYDSSANQTFSGVVSGAGTLTMSGAGTLTLANAGSTYTGTTTISGGTLNAGAGDTVGTSGALGKNGSITFKGGTLQYSSASAGTDYATRIKSSTSAITLDTNAEAVTFAGIIDSSNTAGLTKLGSGTLTLANAGNAYTGATTVKAGTLAIGNLNAAGTNGELDLGVQNVASGILKYTGAAGTFTKNINALGNGGDTIQNSGTGLLTLSGTLTKDGTKLTLKGGANGITVNGGGIAGSSANSDLIIDGGVTTLASANTYNGPTYIRNGATLHADATNALPTANGRSAVILDDIGSGNSTLALGASQSIASLAGVVGSSVNLNDKTLTVGAASGSTTFGGVISGSGGALVKDLASTLVLTGANSFTGGTTVTGGTLLLTGSLASGVTIEGTGTLAGDGTVSGTVDILGTLSPGGTGTIGTLATTGTTILDGTSTYKWEVNNTTGVRGNQDALKNTGAYDFLNVTGGLTINSGFTIDVMALGAVTNWTNGKYAYNWTIASASGGITLGSGIDLTADLRNQTGINFLFTGFGPGKTNDYSQANVPVGYPAFWYLSVNGNDLVLHYVPEPGTLSLLVCGALALLGRRRRDRR